MVSRSLEIVVSWALLIVPAGSWQMPARPGKLHLTSSPRGQVIIIDKVQRTEVTDVTLVLSPGRYTVKVGNCEPQDVSISSGETKEVHCP